MRCKTIAGWPTRQSWAGEAYLALKAPIPAAGRTLVAAVSPLTIVTSGSDWLSASRTSAAVTGK